MKPSDGLTSHERDLLEVFVTATQAAISDWIGVEFFPVEIFADDEMAWLSDKTTAWIPLKREADVNGDSDGSHFAIAMNAESAARFADLVFADLGKPPEQNLHAECLAELANLAAGRAKALTAGSENHFLLGTPSLERPIEGRYSVATLGSELGEITIALDWR